MKVHDIEKNYERAAGGLFFLTGVWGILTAVCIWGIASAWTTGDILLMGTLALYSLGSLTLTVVFWVAYAFICATQAMVELMTMTHVTIPHDAPDLEHYL